uniref:Uncharacterized protein n=1 Tax=Anguilla anguilla TaxID=7936 RepID=A0A0E9T0C5_ANGAN
MQTLRCQALNTGLKTVTGKNSS